LNTRQFPFNRYTAAWLVHAYTATGGVIGVFALLLAGDGETRQAFLLLAITTLIDATDGLLARRVRVSEVLPNFDGAQMDNVIDVLTYVWVPVFIMARESLLPHPAWVIVPVIAAMYAYGQVNMKTPDSFFLGFPSYWNVVALYLFWLRPQPAIALALVIVPAALTFVPTRYLYPSRNQIFWKTTWGLGVIWLVMVAYLLWQDAPAQPVVLLSLFYPAYYLAASFYVDWRVRRGEISAT
jgi:phosphatidylcholine synthase